MIAHLPMYDVPANRAAHRRLWQALQDHLPDAPNFTQPSADLMVDWLSPELYLSQTCGLPYRAALHGQVQLIATPDNQIPELPARLLLLGAAGSPGRGSRPCGQ